ncbi:MAG: hypothetical protein WA749_13260 [Gelidibacter sp.]
MRKISAVLILACACVSCNDIIELEDISMEKVALVAPHDGAVLKTTLLRFSWEPIADADSYQIQIATPNFEAPLQVYVDTTVAVNNLSVALERDSYEWRVKAKNSGYETNYSKQSFTVEE